MITDNSSGYAAQSKRPQTRASAPQGRPDMKGQSPIDHIHSHRLLYDRKEGARQLSISVRTLDYLIAAKELETRRIGKKVLIPHAALVRYSQGNHFESPALLAA